MGVGRRLHIGLVSEHANPLEAMRGSGASGQSLHLADLAAGLSRIGHDVTVFTRRTAPDQPFLTRGAEGYTVIYLSAGPPAPLRLDAVWPHMLEFSQALGVSIDDRRPDILHGHYWMSAWATRFVAVPRRVPWTVTFHALGSGTRSDRNTIRNSPTRVGVERQLARRAGHVIATCRDDVARLLALGCDRRFIAVVPCGVDVARFTPRGRSDAAAVVGSRRQRHRIVSVGRFSPQSGFELLLAALREVPDTELVIAGGGSPAQVERDLRAGELRRLAARLGVQDRLRIIGQVEQARMPELLRSADLLVLSPVHQPYCTVAAEAMACGIPVVATAVDGLWDVVANEVTGTLVATRNPTMFAQATRNLLDDPARRRAYGLAGRLRAEQHYSSTRAAELSTEAYRRATMVSR